MVARLRLVPGHRARIWKRPITSACWWVMAVRPRSVTSSASSGRAPVGRWPLRWRARMATPPAIQAATIGQGPNRASSMASSKTKPTSAEGTKAMTRATNRWRPAGFRPARPSSISTKRRQNRASTATMAPNWMAMA